MSVFKKMLSIVVTMLILISTLSLFSVSAAEKRTNLVWFNENKLGDWFLYDQPNKPSTGMFKTEIDADKNWCLSIGSQISDETVYPYQSSNGWMYNVDLGVTPLIYYNFTSNVKFDILMNIDGLGELRIMNGEQGEYIGSVDLSEIQAVKAEMAKGKKVYNLQYMKIGILGKADGKISIKEMSLGAKPKPGSESFITYAKINDIIGTVAANNVSFTVPFETDITKIIPEFTLSVQAKISPTGEQDFSKPVKYTVTAGDGTTHDYMVEVLKAPNTKNDILSATIDGIAGTIDGRNITFKLPKGTDITKLEPKFELSQNAKIDITGAQDFTNEVEYRVTAQDGESVKKYRISATVEASVKATPKQNNQGTSSFIIWIVIACAVLVSAAVVVTIIIVKKKKENTKE